jgi:L-lactate dehydrogenase
MKIGIIGLGETGATILALLNQKLDHSFFYVYDPADDFDGRVLDLNHACMFKLNRMVVNESSSNIDFSYIFYCAGVRNSKSGDRTDMLQENKQMIEGVFKRIQPRKNTKIIVLTNPVDLMTKWISDAIDEEVDVLGTGTSLDTFRLSYIIEQHLNLRSNSVHVPVVGEHGKGMIPLFSLGKINGQKADLRLTEKEMQYITVDLKNAAKKIRQTEIATKYGVAQCALDIMECFESDESSIRNVSMRLPTIFCKKLGLKNSIFISIPCEIMSNHIRPSFSIIEKLIPLKDFQSVAHKIDELSSAE